MNRHISNEVLSTYLDYRLDAAVQQEVDTHLASCEHCRAQLSSLRSVVSGLSRVARVTPPPGLAQRIRQQAVAQPVSPWIRLRNLIVALPRRSDLRTHFAMAMALVVSIFLVGHGVERKQRDILEATQVDPEGEVTAYTDGHLPADWNKDVTVVIGGRKLVWNGPGLWVEEGLDPATHATAYIDTLSPQGQAILKSFGAEDEDITAALLEGGSRVMVRYNASTVELSTQQRHL